MGREATEFEEQIRSVKDWLSQISRFDSIKTVKWLASTNASLYFTSKPAYEPCG
jgi:hypothetical protein